jgi:hypothetical protein
MKYIPLAIIGLAVAVFAYFGFFYDKNPESGGNLNIPGDQSLSGNSGGWEKKTDDQPPVAVSVVPIELGGHADAWKFTIAFDTHSVDLNDDPMAVATLVDDKGVVYRPTAWEGPGSGGHHREGVLVFSPINPVPSFVELKIKNVGGILERSFRWGIK